MKKILQLYFPVQPEMESPSNSILYKEYYPQGKIAEYVFCYWTYTSPPKIEPFICHAVPDACVDIYFNMNSQSCLKIISIASSALDYKVEPGADFFGIRFFPGMVSSAYKIPVSDVCGRSINVSDIISGGSNELEEKLYCARSTQERIAIAGDYILKKIADRNVSLDSRIGKALINIYNHNGVKSIDILAGDSGMSVKHFRRIFENNVGISPKSFSKTIRFQNILFRIVKEKRYNSMKLAVDFEYYDQAHFLNDFRSVYGKDWKMSLFYNT